jgi:predicted metal-dependent phosphoesterase TrpH
MGKVREAGLRGAALMDHDTLSGIGEARDAADRFGIEFIPGSELSVEHGLSDGSTVKIHMLVYGLEPGDGPLQAKLEWLREGRARRNPLIIEKLNELGYAITMADVDEKAGGESVGRPHIADALVDHGYFADRKETFVGLLNDGGAAYVERRRLDATDAIELATVSGAVTAIAHPLTMGVHGDRLVEVIRDLQAAGLIGLEAHHPMHVPMLRSFLEEFAHGRGLIATGGSDYHGTGKRDYSVGTGTGDLRIPDDAFELIQQAINRARS